MSNHKGNKKIRLSDIADELNISTVSVSNALSGKKGVSDELRQKVFDLAEELNYKHPGMESGKERCVQRNIGVVISERYIDENALSFYMRMYQELTKAVSNKNGLTLLEVMPRAREEALEIPNLFYNSGIDGIIVLGEMQKPYTRLLKEHGKIPVVFLDYYEDIPGTDFILSDSFNGMCAMTRLLIKSGYKSIGFIGALPATSSITDRFLGYKKALQEKGLPLRREWILNAFSGKAGKPEIKFPDTLPDAFVCYNDVTARAAIDTLRGAGYDIPGDIGIVGFDNYPPEDIDGITLTTYDADIRAMSEICVNTLFRKIEHTHFMPKLRVVEGSIIIGNSHKRDKD